MSFVRCYLLAKGQTLVETVIALAVVLILVSALLSLSIASVRSATLSRNKNAASQLAYKEAELLRNVRDVTYAFNWSSLTAKFASRSCSTSGHCNVDSSMDIVSGDKTDTTLVSGTTFTIYFLTDSFVPSALNYTVKVEWTDSSGGHTESISSILTPWK